MKRKIEIVPDQMGGFEIYGRKFEVSAATDTIQRFVDPEYDYFQYLDVENQCIAPCWIGQVALMTLADFGIPETRQRLKMLECEHDEYLQWQSTYGLGGLDFDTDG